MINRAAVDGTPSQIPAFLPLPWCQGHTKCCPIPSSSCDTYAPAKFEVATPNCLGNAFTRQCIK